MDYLEKRAINYTIMKQTIFFLCAALFIIAGCSPTVLPTATKEPPLIPPVTFTPVPITATLAPKETQTPTIFPTTDPVSLFIVSSPLEDIQLNDLKSIISEPFFQSGPELDDGHHGTDFAFYDFGKLTTIVGLPIHSVLNGKVVGVINKKKPYGNLIIIETRIGYIPSGVAQTALPPSPGNPVPIQSTVAVLHQFERGNMDSKARVDLLIIRAHAGTLTTECRRYSNQWTNHRQGWQYRNVWKRAFASGNALGSRWY